MKASESRGFFFNQFLVFKVLRIDESQQHVTKEIRVMPIVETEFKLIKVTVKMLNTDLMIRANDRTLEKRKHAFNAIGVNVAAHVFICAVIHRFVRCVLVCDSIIRLPLVSHNALRLIIQSRLNELVQCLTVARLFDSQTNTAAALNRRQSHSFADRSTSLNLFLTIFL